MSVPDYQSLMLPLLRLAHAGKAKSIAEAQSQLADEFSLSEADRALRLPSGKQTAISNRTGWASFYLMKAGLIEKPKHGVFFITAAGKEALAKNPPAINLEFLLQYPQFREFYQKANVPAESVSQGTISSSAKTPDEVLQAAYATLNNDLVAEVLDRLCKVTPEFFEQVVVELLVAMGYGGSRQDAGEKLGKSGDGGVDGVIKEDQLGLDAIYIQAKRWQSVIGRPEIQKFVGALQGQKARKGVFMTTSWFSAEALEYVSKIESKVVLLDGPRIAKLMIEHDVGVSRVSTFVVKRVDSDYFDEI